MFKYIYGTTRDRVYNSSINLNEISLNGGYTTEFFNKGQFLDYELAGITKLSMPIPNNRYIGVLPQIDENEEVIGTVPKLTRFVCIKYSDKYTNPKDLGESVQRSGSDTCIQIFDTTEEALTWVRSNTDLKEVEPGKFLISEATEFMGEKIEAIYLEIN